MRISHPVAQAADFLTSASGTPKEKLVIGGKLFGAATILPGKSTPDLLERTNSVYRGLLQGGTIQKTVERMDENAARLCLEQLTKDAVELAAAFAQARIRDRSHR